MGFEGALPRHLAYHVFPFRNTADAPCGWKWNVAQLRQRLPLFDGRRVVGIATDRESDPASAVREALAGCGCEFVERENARGLREVTTFTALHEALRPHVGPGDVALYAHAKGVTSSRWATGVGRWAAALYNLTIDCWPAAERLLRTHAVVGPFLADRPIGDPPTRWAPWHFAGSFRWCRADALFDRPWFDPLFCWAGVEDWPGQVFRRDEAACLGPAAGWWKGGTGMYEMDWWANGGDAALTAWREDPQRSADAATFRGPRSDDLLPGQSVRRLG